MRTVKKGTGLLYKPESFDETQIEEKYRWRVLYMYSHVVNRVVHNRRQREQYGEYVCRSWKKWIEVLGREHFGKTKQLAIDIGLLECDNHYVPKSKSFGYRIGRQFVNGEFERVTVTCEKKAEKAVQQICPDLPTEGICGLLAEDLKRVKADLITDDLLWDVAENRPPKVWKPWKKQIDLPVEDVVMIYRTNLWKIRSGGFRLTRDRYGRVHTNITSLKTELRHLLSIDGERLVGVDIKNSQPLLFAHWAKTENESRQKKCSLNNEYSIMSLHQYNECHECAFSMKGRSCLSLKNEDILTSVPCCAYSEVQKLVALAESGRFYEYFAEESGVERGDAKGQFMDFLFGKHLRKLALEKQIETEFPFPYSLVRDYKDSESAQLEDKPHGVFATLLQGMEAEIVIDTVCVRLKRENPAIPLITIHDSILTTPAYLEVVRNVVKEEFNRFGMNVTLEDVAYDRPEEIGKSIARVKRSRNQAKAEKRKSLSL